MGGEAISATWGEGPRSPDSDHPASAGGAQPSSSGPGWATGGVSFNLRVPTVRLSVLTGCSL